VLARATVEYLVKRRLGDISMVIQCKIILIGDGAVGKTSLISRFVEGRFESSYQATLGVDLFNKTVTLPNGSVMLNIWDIAGQSSFATVRSSFYASAMGALLVFDLTRPASFENIPSWIDDVNGSGLHSIPIVLLGNKSDLNHLRGVTKKAVKKFVAESQRIETYLETSAKSGANVEKAFQTLVETIDPIPTIVRIRKKG
jgi:small GTP-binding protein